MVRKRLDDRVRILLERCVATNERSFLVLVGDHGKDQVPNLHQILTKTSLTKNSRPNVLWCYKKELGFSTHRKKRMKKLKRDKARGLLSNNSGNASGDMADNFELFVSSTDIHWCYYKDTHRVLGTTVGMLILQDFEAITPNLMARTMETVRGGGLIVLLLRTVKSLRQLYTMTMDVHGRYRTESAGDIVPRFNERFLLSLRYNTNCLVCDDELNILPGVVSKRTLQQLSTSTKALVSKGDAGEVVVQETDEDMELNQLKESLLDTPHVGVLVDLAKTLDQAKGLLVFLEACSEKTSTSTSSMNNMPLSSSTRTVAMTAARGRGKSAAMGLCLAGAISLGYSTIAVTAPEPTNLVSVFEFCLRGLDALKYQKHTDYTVTYNQASGREEIKCILSIQVHSSKSSHRQIIQYIPPHHKDKFVSAEIIAVDEAAAIPLPVVRALMSNNASSGGKDSTDALNYQPDRLFFLSSTVNGYEGTGRALSLKLIKELRERKGSRQAIADAAANAIVGPKSRKGDVKVHEQRWKAAAEAVSVEGGGTLSSSHLREIELSTPIRYALADPVEAWLNKLLCLNCGGVDVSSSSSKGKYKNQLLKLKGGAPAPMDCELYSVNRDALFSHHKLSEAFLQKLMGLYTSAHYKNTPNDLQMLSDAPAHALFCLLSPMAEENDKKKKKKRNSTEDDDDEGSLPELPDVLCVVQIALEGKISRKAVEAQLARGHRSAGDLIPWTISQQFSDSKFAQLSGARIVRIAVHPSLQGMGYGSRAMELLFRFYNGEMVSLANNAAGNDDTDDDDDDNDDDEEEEQQDSSSSEEETNVDKSKKLKIQKEKLAPRKELPPLLLPLTEVEDTPQLDWIGTSFGLTRPLHRFWSRTGMKMLYLRQTKNELTGEHSAIMVRALPRRSGVDDTWLDAFTGDTKRRFLALLGGPFRDMEIRVSIAVLEQMTAASSSSTSSSDTSLSNNNGNEKISAEELGYILTAHDLKRLELYGRNLCDHHLVTDLLPSVARLYFLGRFGRNFHVSGVQSALLCGIGIQHRDIDSLRNELGLPSNQVLAMFNKAIRKISIALNSIIEEKEKETLLSGENRLKAQKVVNQMRDVAPQTLEEDTRNAAKDAMDALNNNNNNNNNNKDISSSTLRPEIAKDNTLMQYAIKGSDQQWEKALDGKQMDVVGSTNNGEGGGGTTIQISTIREKRKMLDEEDFEKEAEYEKQQQHGNKKKGGKKQKKKRRSRQ